MPIAAPCPLAAVSLGRVPEMDRDGWADDPEEAGPSTASAGAARSTALVVIARDLATCKQTKGAGFADGLDAGLRGGERGTRSGLHLRPRPKQVWEVGGRRVRSGFTSWCTHLASWFRRGALGSFWPHLVAVVTLVSSQVERGPPPASDGLNTLPRGAPVAEDVAEQLGRKLGATDLLGRLLRVRIAVFCRALDSVPTGRRCFVSGKYGKE